MKKTFFILVKWISVFSFLIFHNNAFSKSANTDYLNNLGSRACAECHEKQIKIWKNTKHFKSFDLLRNNKKAVDIAKILNIKKNRIRKSPRCAKCHSTLINKSNKPSPISGVSCESCHGSSQQWIKLHNVFGENGEKGVKREHEVLAHKVARLAKLDKLGMIYPGNMYRFSKNCLECHLVPDAELVNKTKHAAGSQFDFVKRFQGNIKHYPDADKNKIRKMRVIGYAVELEMSLRALSKSPDESKFSKSMHSRVNKTWAYLIEIEKKSGDSLAHAIVNSLNKLSLVALDENQFNDIEEIISKLTQATQKFSEQADGTKLAVVDNPIKLTDYEAIINDFSKSITDLENNNTSQEELHGTSGKNPKLVNNNQSTITNTKINSDKNSSEVPPKKLKKESPFIVSYPAVKIINSLEVSTLLNPEYCNSVDGWKTGGIVLQKGTHLKSNDCIVIRYDAALNSKLYLFSLAEDGTAKQLLPNSCHLQGKRIETIVKKTGNTISSTPKLKPIGIKLNNQKGMEWIYMIATLDDEAVSEINTIFSKNITDICHFDSNTAKKVSHNDFKLMLAQLKKKLPGRIDWTEIHFFHD